MYNAIKCAYWASTVLSHCQKIKILQKVAAKINRHKNNLGKEYKNGIILCVLFVDFAPVCITVKLCNYAAFAQKKAKLSRVVAATSNFFVDFLAGFHTIGR